MPVVEWLFPALAVLAGYVVLGITGFGSALVLVPLLAQKWPLGEVVALAILVDIPASALHGGLNFAQVRWRELGRLVPGMALGTCLGLALLGQVDQRWLLLALGAYVVAVGLRGLLPRAPAAPAAPQGAHLAGLLVGLVEVMFATAGPVVVAWLTRRLDDVAGLRATVPVVMVLAGAVAVSVLGASAQIDLGQLLPRWALALPLAAAGVYLGNRLASRIPPAWMKRFMAGLLAMAGLALMARA
jgi:uncharacterized membrane protein YfcA